jgi:ech hydrogenase subunit B
MSPLLNASLFLLLAPLLGGLVAGVDRRLSARMQGRRGPPLLQPFFDVGKLLQKEPRAVNPLVGPLLWGHLGFMALSGALVCGSVDLLFSTFVLVLAGLCLVLAAGSADSPYSATGASRELLLLLAAEPFFVVLVAAVCTATGEASFTGVLASPVHVAKLLPAMLLPLLLVAALKLRKSPFDLSASHHAHQELARGLTGDFAGPHLALVEIAHWYETTLLGSLVFLLFNWSTPLALTACVVLYAAVVLLDNTAVRARWQLVLRSLWAVNLVFAGGNLFVLYIGGR